MVYSTQYGQTEKIARRIRDFLQQQGLEAKAFSIDRKEALDSIPLDEYDCVVVGAPVYVGKFPPLLIHWAKDHAAQLRKLPTAFFSVSLNAADKRTEARAEDARLVREFLTQTGMMPRVISSLIGALHYRKYGWLKRWMLRRISKSNGGPTDTSQDHELTNWEGVEEFARSVAGIASLNDDGRPDIS